jgi:hypothetical protein
VLEEAEVAGAVEKDEGDKQMPESGKRLFYYYFLNRFSKWKNFTRSVS